MTLKRRYYSKEFVQKKIVIKLRIFLILFIVMMLIGCYDLYHFYINFSRASLAFLCGTALGFLVGSASNVIWHEKTNKVMMKLDIFSGIVLGLYILFAIFKRTIFHHWFSGNELSAFVIFLSAGIMVGRFISIRKQVIEILRKEDKHS